MEENFECVKHIPQDSVKNCAVKHTYGQNKQQLQRQSTASSIAGSTTREKKEREKGRRKEREREGDTSWKGKSKVDEEKVEKDGMAEKVEKVEKVTDEDEGDFRHIEVRCEQMDAKDLEICMKSLRWTSVVDVKTAENLEDIEETWIEVKRRTMTQDPRQSE